METIDLGVKGMTCGGCARSVERVLSGLQGVASVQVSLDEAKARVQFDPALTGRPAMVRAVTEAGFEAA